LTPLFLSGTWKEKRGFMVKTPKKSRPVSFKRYTAAKSEFKHELHMMDRIRETASNISGARDLITESRSSILDLLKETAFREDNVYTESDLKNICDMKDMEIALLKMRETLFNVLSSFIAFHDYRPEEVEEEEEEEDFGYRRFSYAYQTEDF